MAMELVQCPHCQSGEVVKYGTAANGKDCFRCQNLAHCRRTFLREYTYQGRLPQVKCPIVEMTLNGSGGRDIARVWQISPNTVSAELKKGPGPAARQSRRR